MSKIVVIGLVDKRPLVFSLVHWLSKSGEVLVITDNPLYFRQNTKVRYIDDVHFVFSISGNVDKDTECYELSNYDYIIYDYFNDITIESVSGVVIVNGFVTEKLQCDKVLKIIYSTETLFRNKESMFIKQELNHIALAQNICLQDSLVQSTYKDMLKAAAAMAELLLPQLKSKLIYNDIRKDV